MSDSYKKYISTSLNLAVLSILFIIILQQIINNNNSTFVYPLDDTYIHLALAKNLSNTSVLGINPGQFAYITSSPLWTLLLTLIYKIGLSSVLMPLFLNFVLAVLLIYSANKIIRKHIDNMILETVLLLTCIIMTSAIHLIFLGMEHLLHAYLTVLFIFSVADISTGKAQNKFYLIILTILFSLSRYESFFLIIPAILILFIRKEFLTGFIIFITSVVPLSVIGFYSISQGWFFFPTSILLKSRFALNNSDMEMVVRFFRGFLSNLYHYPAITSILILSVVMLIRNKHKIFNNSIYLSMLLFFILTILHAFFAKFDVFYRYEAYIIFAGLLINGISIVNELKQFKSNPKRLIYSFVVLILLIPVFIRAYNANTEIVKASGNIYSQQWHMSEFLRLNYPNQKVVVNDIGLISYRSNVEIFDLWGLANKEIAKMKLSNKISDKAIERLVDNNNSKIAILYPDWFKSKQFFTGRWLIAGSWTLKDNIVCGGDRVVFLAKDSVELRKLVKNLIVYSRYVDDGNIQKINN